MDRSKTYTDLARKWELRWMARTDLVWLCRNVLDYNLVVDDVHGPVANHLQQFPMPTEQEARASDLILNTGSFQYTPWCDPYVVLEGMRRRMTFDSRGYFKTTVCTVAHTIQWLLNFPHIAMGIFFATDGKAQDVLKSGIKRHFQTNKKLRELFPEYCPQRRIMDWGTAEEFTLECRDAVLQRMKLPPRIEPSVKSLALEKSMVGYHFDIIKCSDLVDNKNSVSPTSRAVIENDFGLMPKLLVRRFDGKQGWIDVEGTFYHPDDLHLKMVKDWREKETTRRLWQIFVRGVFKRDIADAKCDSVRIPRRKERKYDPDEMMLPFELDERGKRKPTWPAAETIEQLELEEADLTEGGPVFASQRVLDMTADKSSNRPFQTGPTWKKLESYQKIPISHRYITCDFADTTGPKSNPSVITTSAIDRYGLVYVEKIERGWWGVDETVRRLFDAYDEAHHPHVPVKVVSIEEYAYVRGLKPTIERESMKRHKFPPFDYLKRDRSPNGKVKRILHALQTPIKARELMFVEPLHPDPVEASKVQHALEAELRDCTVYSTGSSDDILDTLADIFIVRLNAGVNRDAAPEQKVLDELQKREFAKQWDKMLFGGDELVTERSPTGW